jgi:hypothetical protein
LVVLSSSALINAFSSANRGSRFSDRGIDSAGADCAGIDSAVTGSTTGGAVPKPRTQGQIEVRKKH